MSSAPRKIEHTKALLHRVITTLYNGTQCFLWYRVALAMITNAVLQDWDFEKIVQTNHLAAGSGMLLCQRVAMFELLLSLSGILPTPFFNVALQLIARNTVFILVVCSTPSLHQEQSLFLIYIAWVSTELIRFPWLFSKSFFGGAPSILTYLRYTIFIPMYPLGALGEGTVMWLAKDQVHERTFLGTKFLLKDFIYFVYGPAFLFGFFILYAHMFVQRSRKLRNKTKSKRH